ncbi:MAG: acyl-CoA dehydrogenase family protein [Alphaproteobacteria bacterium]|nr:acyl-CoA dehydrogenase family protein [Alphaproteobacteria bacterium]
MVIHKEEAHHGSYNARKKLKLCSEHGVLRHGFPKIEGGYEDSFESLCKAHEYIGEETLDVGLIISLNAHIWGGIFPLVKFGSAEQKQKWLSRLLNGQLISGHAITEPEAGSDVRNILTQAKIYNDGYLISGRKRYISNAPIADCLIVYAKEAERMSAFIVKKTDEGVLFTDEPHMESFKKAPIGDVILKDCFIPSDRLIGNIGSGMIMIQSTLEYERAFLFAGLLGVMKHQLQKVIDYSRKRQVENQPLGKNQAISHKIADMSMRLETTRLWIYNCAKLADKHKRITVPSSYTKLYASEAFLQSSLNAIHIMGAKGLESSQQLSQYLVDAAACQLLSGSTEIQKNIISGILGIGNSF